MNDTSAPQVDVIELLASIDELYDITPETDPDPYDPADAPYERAIRLGKALALERNYYRKSLELIWGEAYIGALAFEGPTPVEALKDIIGICQRKLGVAADPDREEIA